MTVKRMNVAKLDTPVGPYVHAVQHENVLYTSGMTAFGSDAQSGSIADQADEIFRQLAIIAEANGSSMSNLIKVTIFVTDLEQIGDLRDRLFQWYGENLPASSLVEVQNLFHPDLNIEIEATFAI